MPNLPPVVWAAIITAVMTFQMGRVVVKETKVVFRKAQALVAKALHPHRKAEPVEPAAEVGKEKQ